MQKNKPKILLLPDYPNRPFGIRSRIIKKKLGNFFDFDIKYFNDQNKKIKKINLKKYDCILSFRPLNYQYINFKQTKAKKITGIFSYKWLNKKKQTRKSLKNYDLVITNCGDLKKKIEKIYHPIFYTPNGVEIEKFKPVVNRKINKKFTVGWVGNDKRKEKNFYSIIKPAIENLKKDNIILKSIKYNKNEIQYNKLYKFYNKLDVYVCASDSEGGPNTVFEAAACQIPIISTPVGEVKKIIKNKDFGLIIKPNQKSLEKALLLLKNNPDLRKKMGVSLRREIVKNWTWNKKINNYKKIFEICCNIKTPNK